MASVDMKDIVRRLKDPGEQVRIDGCIALARSGHDAAMEILSQVAERDPGPRVRYAARKLVEHVRATRTVAVARGPEADLGSADPERRLAAAVALASSADGGAVEAVRAALAAEGDPRVQAALLTALGRLGGEGDVKLLAHWLRDANARVRANAVDALLELGTPLALALVFPLLQDGDHRVRANAAKALALEGEDGALGVLTRMVASEKIWMRDAAAHACGVLEDERAVELLLRLHADRNRSVRQKAQRGLEGFAARGSAVARRFLDGLDHEEAPPRSVDEVAEEIADAPPGVEALEDGNPKLRMNVVNAIIEADDRARLPELVEHLSREENDFVSSRILSAIGLLGKDHPLEHADVLREYLVHPDLRTVANAIDAAARLGLSALRPQIRPFLRSRDTRIRASALVFLFNDPEVDLMRELSELVDAPDPALRRAAIFAVERLARKRPETVGALLPLLEETDAALHWDLVEALERLAAEGVAQARKLLPSVSGEELGTTVLEMEVIRLQRATFLKRCLAFVFDNFLMGGAFFFLLLVVLGFTALVTAGDRGAVLRHVSANASVVGLLYALLFFLRDGFASGRGLGKRFVGLRVVDVHTGGGCGYFRSLLRQATLGMPVVNVVEALLTAFDARGRRLIDKLLGTQVIDEKRRELQTWEQWVAMIGAGLVGLFTFLSLLGLLASVFGRGNG